MSFPMAKLLYKVWDDEETNEDSRELRLVSKGVFGWNFSWEHPK